MKERDRWSVVQRTPKEKKEIIGSFTLAFRTLGHEEIWGVRHKNENAIIELEERAFELDIAFPRPPLQLYGAVTKEQITQNMAEWQLYRLDLEELIRAKTEEREAPHT